jgi:FtsZ-interacting cell division protein YlmF
MTGIGASIGVMGLARQGRTKIGMVDPEEYFDADQFIADLRERPGVTVEITEASSDSDS